MPDAAPHRSRADRDLAALTAAVRAGDPAALEALYSARFGWVLAAARRRSGRDEGFCLDIVQETFLRVVRSLPVLEHDAQLDAWLAKSIDSCVRDAMRSQARRGAREPTHHRASKNAAPTCGDIAAIDVASDGLALAPQLAKLPPADLDLLTARYRFGWTLAKIGAALGLRTGAVDGRLSRVLARLRKELDDGRS